MSPDVLRLEVLPAPDDVGGFELQVFVNEVEMTTIAAGLGMDPYDVFVPVNRLLATPDPHVAPIARCDCGIYGCGTTDVRIARDGGLVRWEWLHETPIDRDVCFDADAYDAEMARLTSSYDWETPDRTAGRLVLASVDRAALADAGLRVSWVSDRHDDPAWFRTALMADDAFQVFLDLPWAGRSPSDLATAVLGLLASDPRGWTAEWWPIRRDGAPRPRQAGPLWRPTALP